MDDESGGWLTEPAPAKVNLFLHVVGRRSDGYHMLDSLAVFPGPGDVLRAQPAKMLTLDITGPFAAGLTAGDDNLVLRAARALAPGRGARLILEKNLPVASGIGGGSADAAAALRLLARLWGLDTDLIAIAAKLGADVPVCVQSRPVRMGGIGEIMTAAPSLPAGRVLLVNPGIAVSTPEVFRHRVGGIRKPAVLPGVWASMTDMIDGLTRTTNDLEPPAQSLAPAVTDTLEWMKAIPGCRLARMSGSGATCFGLFDPAIPDLVVPSIPENWWWAAGRIGPPP